MKPGGCIGVQTLVKVGDLAPDFEGAASDGSKLRLSDFLGKKNVVLYFYPEDDTEDCTIEACNFRDRLQSIRAMWTEVIGVSLDSIESHREFSQKHKITFPLVSDKEKKIARAYGVLGGDGEHAERVTFIIDRTGRVVKIFPKVDVTRHTHEVVEALKLMTRKPNQESLETNRRSR
jgi:peroxiredoxin Q/BCP